MGDKITRRELDFPKPEVQTESITTKTVRMELTPEQVEEIVRAWVVKNIPQFRGTEIQVSCSAGRYAECTFSCTIEGKKETST